MTDTHPLDYAVFIGRLQPMHNAHLEAINKCLELAQNVIIVLGSANQPRTLDNPLLAYERQHMVHEVFDRDPRIQFVHATNHIHDNAWWASEVRKSVTAHIGKAGWTDYPPKVGLVAHRKDNDSFWVDYFPEWEFIELPQYKAGMSSTVIRGMMLADREDLFKDMVPPAIHEHVVAFMHTLAFEQLQRDHLFIQKYREKYGPGPFVAADAVVICQAHVLMIRRGKDAFGAGLLALPGGFVNPDEFIYEAAIRELKEETGLVVLPTSCRARGHFEHPKRSQRARIITHAFHFQLNDVDLPEVTGGDDAGEAFWMPLADLDVHRLGIFDDHADIVHFMVMETTK